MKSLINNLPQRYRWTIHNLIAHPATEICYQTSVTLELVGNKILTLSNALKLLEAVVHDSTIPDHQKGQGRG